MKLKSVIKMTTTLAVTAALALPGAAQAASPGDLCRVAAGTGGGPVFKWVSGLPLLYVIPEGGYFRVESYGTPINGVDTYMGHGTSQATGALWRWVIDQSSCHP